MNPVFKNRVWQLTVPAPWRVADCDHCVEINQPEGVGSMHISNARKKEGVVTDEEMFAKMKGDCPGDTDTRKVQCGDFAGYTAEYVDWHADQYWRVWFLAHRQDLLHVTYVCKRGDEELEVQQAAALLSSLRTRT